jgi:addiction module HigA family antidote
MSMHNPAHPGEVLREYMGEMDATSLARSMKAPRFVVLRILNGQTKISAGRAIRLAGVFPNTSPDFWLRLQINYDQWQARKE